MKKKKKKNIKEKNQTQDVEELVQIIGGLKG
jgi:hypothetical protein